MDEVKMIIQLKCWLGKKKRKKPLNVLLVMDSLKACINDNVNNIFKAYVKMQSLFQNVYTHTHTYTKKLQPLDSGINRSFKNKAKNF